MIAERPGGGWIMAYTGVSETLSQRIGFLTSDDLETWTPLADSLPFEPDSSLYRWTATAWANARDPHLVLIQGIWHLLYCAWTPDAFAAMGHAESTDLIHWTHHGPLLRLGDFPAPPDLESPAVLFLQGKTYLYWSWKGCRIARGDSLG